MHKNKAFFLSLFNAINGLKTCLSSEKNARFHLFAAVFVILLASFLRLPLIHWVFLLLTICIVWITELFNTALEYLFDFAQPEIDPLVKKGKDISAAAVLIASIFSAIVGILILGPPFYRVLINAFG